VTATWPCGTARSTGNAFDCSPRPVVPLTEKQITLAKQKAYWHRKQAEKVNKNTHIGAHCGTTQGQRAAR